MNRISIQSIDEPRLDPYRDLKNSSASRKQQWFIAEGRLVVERLLKSSFPVISVVVGESRLAGFAERIPPGTETLVLPDPMVEQLVGFDFHSGVIACARRREASHLGQLDFSTPGCQTLVACPYITLPENLGMIIRLCAAFGIQGLLVGNRSCDPFCRRTVRVSMGNVFRVPVISSPDVIGDLMRLRDHDGFEIIAVEKSTGANALNSIERSSRSCLVFGNEATGIDSDVRAFCDQSVEIPIAGDVDSLNVATAAAIFLHHFTRVIGKDIS